LFFSLIMKLPIRELTLMAVLPMSNWAIAADSTTPSVTPDEAFNRLAHHLKR
jgi:hypothetical protein